MLKEKVLDTLFREEITQKELTLRLRASRSRMSEILKILENKGLIKRRKVSQRTVLVSLNHSRTLRIGILRSSEYVHVVGTLRGLADKIPFRVTVYENSMEALKELMTGAEDIVASPLISGYFFYLIDRSIKPVAGIARGGAGIIKRSDHGKIGTTPLSRMDKDSRELKDYEQVYFKSMGDMLLAYRKKEIEAAQIWEPFLSMNEGIKSPPNGVCCCLFTHGKSGQSINSFLSKYVENVQLADRKAVGRGKLSALSKLIGVKESDVAKSVDSYKFTTSISKTDLESQIESFGLPLVKEVESFLERSSKVPL
jgi:predicted transcriptional regulator